MADIFDEIDEELKQDRTKALWTRYGKFVIAAATAVVIGVGLAGLFSLDAVAGGKGGKPVSAGACGG